jgi:hypothetical protein
MTTARSSPCNHHAVISWTRYFITQNDKSKEGPRALCNCHAWKGGHCLPRCTFSVQHAETCRCGCQSGARYCGVGVAYWACGVMNSKYRGLCYLFVVEITKLERQATHSWRRNIEGETVECTLSGQIFMHKHEAAIYLCSNLSNAFGGRGQSTKSNVMSLRITIFNTPMTAMLITVVHIESCALECSSECLGPRKVLSQKRTSHDL